MASENQPQLGGSLRSPGRPCGSGCRLQTSRALLLPDLLSVRACVRNRVTQSCSGKKIPVFKPVSAILYRVLLDAGVCLHWEAVTAARTTQVSRHSPSGYISYLPKRLGDLRLKRDDGNNHYGGRTSEDGRALSSAQ